MVTVNRLTLSFVEGENFRELMVFVKPDSTIVKNKSYNSGKDVNKVFDY